jgi:hypothetical protein
MALRGPPVFRAAIGEHAVQRNVVLLEEGQDPIIEQFRGRHRRLAVVQLGKAD